MVHLLYRITRNRPPLQAPARYVACSKSSFMRLNTLMKGEVDKQKGWFDFSEARLFWAGNKDRQTSLSRERES